MYAIRTHMHLIHFYYTIYLLFHTKFHTNIRWSSAIFLILFFLFFLISMCVNMFFFCVFQWLTHIYSLSTLSVAVCLFRYSHHQTRYLCMYVCMKFRVTIKNASLLLFFFFSSFFDEFFTICANFLIDTITFRTIYECDALGLHTIQTIILSKTHFVCDNYI